MKLYPESFMIEQIKTTEDTPAPSSDALLNAIADLLQCFDRMEGTWFQREWHRYGISEEMAVVMEQAWDTKYGHKSMAPAALNPES